MGTQKENKNKNIYLFIYLCCILGFIYEFFCLHPKKEVNFGF
jgi:hypothetical protein